MNVTNWAPVFMAIIVSITAWNIAKLIVEEVESWREAIYPEDEEETKEP